MPSPWRCDNRRRVVGGGDVVNDRGSSEPSLRPAAICQALLSALEAAEGRRRKRKRDQTPDAIGLSIKRSLLALAVHDDPGPEVFEDWLLDYPRRCTTTDAPGAVAAMARSVLEEWRSAEPA